jgi:hypothetical protein
MEFLTGTGVFAGYPSDQPTDLEVDRRATG